MGYVGTRTAERVEKERAMLPPFIIEQIREREERERRNAPQPYLEMPVPPASRGEPREQREPEERDRGIVIIDLMAD
jgi:hypothetical protein